MRNLGILLPVLLSGPALACSSMSPSGQPPEYAQTTSGPSLPGTGETVSLPKGVWFQQDGGLLVVGKGGRVRFELSAPITPCASALDAPYPSLQAEREQLAARASLTFNHLRSECIPGSAQSSDQQRSDEQLRQNYLVVARCAKDKLGARPEWFPALVADVDICARVLGPSFSLPRREELDAITPDERTAMAQALFAAEAGIGYESLNVYARQKDGSIASVSLGHSHAPVALRCLRTKPRKPTPPGPVPEAAACAKSLLAQAKPVPPPPPPLGPLPLPIARFVEFAKKLQGAAPELDLKACEREMEKVKAPAGALAARVGETARARREASERYQQAVLAVEEEGVSEAEHERRVQEFKALRKKVEGSDPGPALSASDARDFSELEGAVKAIDAWLGIEIDKRQKELACIASKCGTTRAKALVEAELKTIRKVKDKLGKLLHPGSPEKK